MKVKETLRLFDFVNLINLLLLAAVSVPTVNWLVTRLQDDSSNITQSVGVRSGRTGEFSLEFHIQPSWTKL